ncbi:MAG: S-methyl-5'-thioinosine phosphorylase [Burkholderiaceae bacterium]
MFGILGGSGLTSFAELEIDRREVVRTPWGEPSGPVTIGRIDKVPVAFLPRHGHGHTIPPHAINYRANLHALRAIGVEGVIAVASVGGIRHDMQPGAIALLDQLLDYTWGRDSTYFDGPEHPVTHIDFTLPYDPALRARMLMVANKVGHALIDGGCYACMQGPRLETAAEIDRVEKDGADVVGMTLMPEAALARELDMPYAALAVVVNHAAGRGDSRLAISTSEIGRILEIAMGNVRKLIVSFVREGGVAAAG